MNLLFVNGKGGVGKSTLAFLFCLSLARAGKTVNVLDLDPQRSLSAWLDHSGFTLDPKGQITIVDTPPRLEDPAIVRAIKMADRILIPTMASPAEIAVAQATAEVVRLFKSPECRAMMVINRVRRGTRLAALLVENGAADMKAPVCKTTISDREVFKHALTDGLRALDATARDEILNLALEIQ